MKPIILKGHERPITKVKYNHDSDLLVSCSKDGVPTAWYTHNGERLGTYEGHNGAVWDCDINRDSTLLATGASDRSAKIWDMEHGKVLHTIELKASVRSVNFSYGDHFLSVVQDSSFKATPTIFIYQLPDDSWTKVKEWTPSRLLFSEDDKDGKICDAIWGSLNQDIIAGYSDGSVRKWDVETGEVVANKKEHSKAINSVQFSKDSTMFVTASSDQTAKLWDTKTMTCLKTYQSDRPLNSAAISPTMKHVIMGGGQEAMNVTRTGHKSGHFEVDFYHLVLQEFLGSVKGHFGPVHTVAFSPDGKSYASGSEDGYIRLHNFPASYFDPKDKLY
jgi:translation initiation factor 3 subunit I